MPFIVQLVTLIALLICDKSSGFINKEIFLTLGESVTVDLEANLTYHAVVNNITEKYTYTILQSHSFNSIVSVSLVEELSYDQTKTGRNVGVLKLLLQGEDRAEFWVRAPETNTTATLRADAYTKLDPIPGGCNLEFNLEYDPNLLISQTEDITTMEFQLANVGFDRTQVAPSCEQTTILKFLRYDVYLYYGGEGVTDTSPLLSELQYFNNGDMQHLDPINLHKFTYTYGHGKTRLLFARYPNIATYYTVIVRNLFNNGTGWSSYVPVVSDGCHTQSTGWFNCGETYNLAARIVCTVVGVIGLFLCFFGHRFFRTEMFLVGSTSTLLVSYILVLKYSTFSNIGQYITSGVSGLVGGILWFTFWYFVGIPVLSVLLIGLLLGYLISSIAFNLTPLGDLDYWATEFNYGMAFTCGILVVPVLLLAFTKQLNIIATSILGSFAVVVAIDVYIGSYMAYIIQDSIRKATIEDFRLVHTKPPFQIRDMILCVIWVLLTICGISFQNWREKDRKPFPDCPNTIRKLKARRRLAGMNTDGAPTPRTPLLAGQQASARSYGIDPGSRSYGSPGTGAGAYPARTVDTSGFVDAGNTATDRQIDRYASQPT